jgi:hypothetical protein
MVVKTPADTAQFSQHCPQTRNEKRFCRVQHLEHSLPHVKCEITTAPVKTCHDNSYIGYVRVVGSSASDCSGANPRLPISWG